MDEITTKAKQEGQVNRVGMPPNWANWKEIEDKYQIKYTDTEISSAQELAKFKAEKKNASADIGDMSTASQALSSVLAANI